RAVPDMGARYGPDVMLDDVRTESELLVRYLVLTEAALRHPDVPPGTRAELLDPVFGLREWMPAFLTGFREMEAALDSLGLPEPPGYEARVQRFPR
ncbi:MAG TPA: hypothetical protein VFQ39_01000, partial [Longimicrobium sp.]|nr:hypothetical protein [Longimicrobium sp.]